MAKKGSFSKVYDKNGDYADVEAVRFDGSRTFQIQGDVTASQTWNGDSNTALTLNASIGAKKVTQDKIADKAVGTGQMADGSVGLTQMSASAMTDTVSANNSKLVTSQGVNAAIAAATLNRGKDYGPLSVDEINAISETIPTGSTVYVKSLGASDAKVINDGYSDGTMASFSVDVGEDLKYYRSPDNSVHGWYSTEANVKVKQPANYAGGIAVDSAQDASSGSAGIEFIRSFKQDTNGNMRDIVKAQVDIVDSTSSTRTNAAATPNSVKSAYDLANTANTGLANKLDKTGDGKDVTVSFSEASARVNIGTGEKLSVMFGKIKKWFTDLGTAAFKNVPASGNASSTEVVLGNDTRLSAGASAIQGVKVNNTTLTPDANKVVMVPLATASADGAMSAADKTKLNGIAAGAEANVQADWNETASSSDAFIKNKPFYHTSTSTNTIKKVCTVTKRDSAESVEAIGIDFIARRYAGAIRGRLTYKTGWSIYLEKCGNVSLTNSSVSIYYAIDGDDSSKIVVYASIGAYGDFCCAPAINYPKSHVNFDSFGTVVSALPEGATEITPVWVANSASSSGTAPVKVGAYGALTPVPMDSTPTESSTNLMTSGDIKTALDMKADKANITGATKTKITYNSQGIVTAGADLEYGDIPIGNKYNNIKTFEATPTPWLCYEITSMELNADYKAFTAEIMVFPYGSSSNSKNLSYKVSVHWSRRGASVEVEGSDIRGAWTAVVVNSATPESTDATTLKLYCTPSAYTTFRLHIISCKLRGSTAPVDGTITKKNVQEAIPEASELVIIGTTTVKTLLNTNDITSTYSSTGTQAVNGTAVAAAIATSLTDVAYAANASGGGGNLNKTINGTTTSVLAFMNDSEAVAIWADAKTAAAKAS